MRRTIFISTIIVLTGVVVGLLAARQTVAADETRSGFVDRESVIRRFDQETYSAVAALETVLEKYSITAEAEAAILGRSREEKIQALRQAEQILRDAGIASDSPEMKAVRKAAIGSEEWPAVPVEEIESDASIERTR